MNVQKHKKLLLFFLNGLAMGFICAFIVGVNISTNVQHAMLPELTEGPCYFGDIRFFPWRSEGRESMYFIKGEYPFLEFRTNDRQEISVIEVMDGEDAPLMTVWFSGDKNIQGVAGLNTNRDRIWGIVLATKFYRHDIFWFRLDNVNNCADASQVYFYDLGFDGVVNIQQSINNAGDIFFRAIFTEGKWLPVDAIDMKKGIATHAKNTGEEVHYVFKENSWQIFDGVVLHKRLSGSLLSDS